MSFTKIPILLPYLFKKKLLILSTSFFCLSAMKFFLLRLDRFTQFMNSSVMICLEFVFLNLRLTVFEDLLPLSVQESPHLFAFRVLSLNFLAALVTYVSANHGFPFLSWRQTGRQAFFFRVIGSSSARTKERLTDGDVIVVEVFGEPLPAQGLLIELDISLFDEVVVGLKTCGGVPLVRKTQLLSGSARGCNPPHQGSRRCKAVRRAGRWEWWRDRRSEWRSRRGYSTHAWNMATTMVWIKHKIEPQCVRALSRLTTKDNDTNWQQKERLRKRRSTMHEDSCIGINYAHAHVFPNVSDHSTHCWASFHHFNSIAVII